MTINNVMIIRQEHGTTLHFHQNQSKPITEKLWCPGEPVDDDRGPDPGGNIADIVRALPASNRKQDEHEQHPG